MSWWSNNWQYILSILTGLPISPIVDSMRDENGMNQTDRQYIAYLKQQVEKGAMTEEEAKAKLAEGMKNSSQGSLYGEDAPGKLYDSVSSGEGSNFNLEGGLNLSGLVDSLIGLFTRNHLTGAEQEQNAFNANEAQLSRNFTEYMARNKYSMETQSMQEAGVNPAMVYGGGNLVSTASNGATGSGSVMGAGNIADLMSVMMTLPLEMKRMQAEIQNTRAKTRLTDQQTQTEVQETRIRSINADYGDVLNAQTLENMKAEYENTIADTDYKTANKDYVLTQQDAQEITNEYLGDKYQAEINNLKGSTAKMSVEEAKTRSEKVYQDWYNNFVKANGFLPSSNDVLVIATYIASLFDIDKGNITEAINDLIKELTDMLKNGDMPHVSKKKEPTDAWKNELERQGIPVPEAGGR